MKKVNATLARLVMRDITQSIGFTFKFSDRMSRAEAAAVLDRARRDPEVLQIVQRAEATPVGREGMKLYRQVLEHFAIDHPEGPGGVPAPFERPAFVATDPAKPFAGMGREDADAVLAWARAQPGFVAAYTDKSHPGHAEYMAQVQALHEIAFAPPSEGAPPAPTLPPGEHRPRPGGVAPRSVEAIRSDPAYLSASHPRHVQAVAEMTAAYAARSGAAAAPPGPTLPLANRQPPPGGAASRSVEAIQSDPAYLSASHPRHAQAVSEMTAAYAARSGTAAAPPGPTLPPGNRQPSPGGAASRSVEAIRLDPAYQSASHPGHSHAVAEMTAAYAARSPAPPSGGAAAPAAVPREMSVPPPAA